VGFAVYIALCIEDPAMSDTPKLSNNDKRDLVIQAGMQLVPYVGGSLSALYFGAKQEMRFKRLESFYQELAAEIEKMKDGISSIDRQDPAALEAIIESLHQKSRVGTNAGEKTILQELLQEHS